MTNREKHNKVVKEVRDLLMNHSLDVSKKDLGIPIDKYKEFKFDDEINKENWKKFFIQYSIDKGYLYDDRDIMDCKVDITKDDDNVHIKCKIIPLHQIEEFNIDLTIE